MQNFKELETKLRFNNEYFSQKSQELMEKLLGTSLFDGTFELAQLCNFYVDHVIKQVPISSLDPLSQKYGEAEKNMTLYQLVQNQRDHEFYEKIMCDLQFSYDILEHIQRPQPVQEEEKKQNYGNGQMNQIDNNINFQDLENPQLTKEDEELIALYGPKIRVIKWYFENDSQVQQQVKERKKNKGVIGGGNRNSNINNAALGGALFGNRVRPAFDDEEDKNQEEEDINYKVIDGVGYSALNEDQSNQIEEAFQEYIARQRPQDVYIQSGEDIYMVRFDPKQRQVNGGCWEIKNTQSQVGRVLRRQIDFKGPFKTTRKLEWIMVAPKPPVFSEDIQAQFTETYKKSESTGRDESIVVKAFGYKYVFIVESHNRNQPYIIELGNLDKHLMRMKENIHRWDFVSTFRPPEHLSVESGRINMIKQIFQGEIDYDFVSEKFLSTFNPNPANPNAGILFARGPAIANVQIVKIEKVFNCVIYERFIQEFKRMLRKYPHRTTKYILKHLFHGPNQTDPKLIYESEIGLDARFAKAGAYGEGVYFANNSQYSHSFTYRKPDGTCQMFMALVLVGESSYQQPGKYKMPPLKAGSQVERYDSINNGAGGHHIIYDNLKSYPGYLITYK
eukprot:403352164